MTTASLDRTWVFRARRSRSAEAAWDKKICRKNHADDAEEHDNH